MDATVQVLQAFAPFRIEQNPGVNHLVQHQALIFQCSQALGLRGLGLDSWRTSIFSRTDAFASMNEIIAGL